MDKRNSFLAYSLPDWDENEVNAVADAVRSNWWSKGPKVAEFEEQFAKYIGVKHALAVNSCTAAMHLALVAKDIGPGDEVITTTLTFCSSANVIVHTGATPVFVDVDDETGLIDADKIEEKITSRTKAIIPVHYAGRACDMDKINAIAKKHNLFVLEDSAHAIGTMYNGKIIGNNNNLTAFSFYATKNIATGEGGMLTTNDDEIYEKAKSLSTHGMSRNAWNRYAKGGSWRYDVLCAGYKYNMTDIAAALGIVQLAKIDKMNSVRRKYADYYNSQFADLDTIDFYHEALGRGTCWHLYIIRVKNELLKINRDEFIDILADDYNIGTSVHFIPLHLQPFYKEKYGYKDGDYPVAEGIFKEIISLPLYPSMKEEDVAYVARAVREIAQKYAK